MNSEINNTHLRNQVLKKEDNVSRGFTRLFSKGSKIKSSGSGSSSKRAQIRRRGEVTVNKSHRNSRMLYKILRPEFTCRNRSGSFIGNFRSQRVSRDPLNLSGGDPDPPRVAPLQKSINKNQVSGDICSEGLKNPNESNFLYKTEHQTPRHHIDINYSKYRHKNVENQEPSKKDSTRPDFSRSKSHNVSNLLDSASKIFPRKRGGDFRKFTVKETNQEGLRCIRKIESTKTSIDQQNQIPGYKICKNQKSLYTLYKKVPR